ncbi:MAG TPA: ATP-grasp domain-containing protein, partial [Allocoleopsis sp.]
MELLEYQAKELFREVGIPILPSQRIDHPSELKSLKIPYPIVLKSQVPASGRASAGGIRFAENTIDAIAATRNIFNLAILGEYPAAVLAEVKYNAHQEFYLAVVLDYSLRRPLLLGSIQGGRDLELVLESMHYVVVDQQFSPFYARKLLVKMGLTGHLLQTVSSIVEKMYYLFAQKDLDIVEINPLGISVTGEVMALDGKISINDTAIARHPELSLIGANINNNLQYIPSLNITDALSNIAILCNGTGTAITTIDLLGENKIKPAYC